MTHIVVRLLGPFRVTVDERLVTAFYSDKVRALLAYLATECGIPHRRETLAGLLWPDYVESSARQSLSQALFALRKALGASGLTADACPWLVVTREEIELCPTDDCWVDVVELEALLQSCRAHDHPDATACSECAERLERAASLYTGEFLEGLSLRDSVAFDEWLVVRRERYRRLVVGALRDLADLRERLGDQGAALAHARRWVELEPLDEEGHRRIMRLLAVAGRRSEAMAQYETCRRSLRVELGVEPDARTAGLLARIRGGRFPGLASRPDAASARPPPFLSQQERYRLPLFVAREDELAQLRAHLDQALAGQAQIAFVTGEAGCGKTALIHEFCRRARRDHPHLVTATGRCNAHTGIGDPYLAFREILAQLSGDVETHWAAGAIDSEEASRLWALLPHASRALAEAGPDLLGVLLAEEALLARADAAAEPNAPWLAQLHDLVNARRARPAATDLQQIALFEQATHVLQRLARERPLLLVLEDLHWADAGSISLLFHLGCHLAADPILVVGTFRPAELVLGRSGALSQPLGGMAADERHPLEPVLYEFQRRFGPIEVNLGHADGRAFVEALLDAEDNALDVEFREALYQQAGGNALFTTELLRGMRERGDLLRDADGRWVASERVHWGELPARIEAVIAQRVGRLPPAMQEALRVGSLEGEIFTAEAVAQVLKAEPRGMVRALSHDVARRHSLVTGAGIRRLDHQPLSSYRFRHILIQRYLYDTLDEAERAYLHGAVGDALGSLYGEGNEDIAVPLARHYELAGDTVRAIAYLRQAALRSTRLLADQEATDHLVRALALLKTLPEGRERDVQELGILIALASSLERAEGYAATQLRQVCDRARELCQHVDDPIMLFRSIRFSMVFYGLHSDWRLALSLFKYGIHFLGERDAHTLTAGMRNYGAWVFYALAEFSRAVSESRMIIAHVDGPTFEEIGDIRDISGLVWKMHAQAWMANALAALGYPDQAMACRQKALDLAERLDSPWQRSAALCIVGAWTPLLLRRYELAMEAAQTGKRLAEDNRFPQWLIPSLLQMGYAECGLGQPREAIAHLRENINMLRANGCEGHTVGFLVPLADAHGQIGETEEGLRLLAEMEDIIEISGERWNEVEMHLIRGELLCQRGDDPEVVEECYRQAIAVAQRQEARLFELRATTSLARLLRDQDRVAEAREALAAIYGWFTEGFDAPDLVEARALLEELAAALLNTRIAG